VKCIVCLFLLSPRGSVIHETAIKQQYVASAHGGAAKGGRMCPTPEWRYKLKPDTPWQGGPPMTTSTFSGRGKMALML
jgi:hypothetical protein